MNGSVSIRVLLVEDNPGDAEIVRTLLDRSTDTRFELEWAHDLRAGMERLRSRGVDLVLLDLGLPESEGEDTFAIVRRTAPQTPVVVLTGLAQHGLAFRLVQAGAQDYLTKGRFDGELLIRTLRYAFERHQAILKIESYHRRMVVSEKLAALGTLITGIAHEINSPLAYLRTNHFVLRRMIDEWGTETDDDRTRRDKMLHTLETNEKGIDRIEAIVGSLRTLGKPQRGRRAAFDLRQVIKDTLPVLDAARKQADVVVHVATDPTPLMLEADATQVAQVILNLVRNAIEASCPGQEVHVRAHRRDDGALTVEVEDEGEGISDDIHDRVFDPFFTTKETGTGLGLAISSEIAEAHGGRLELGETRRGKGSLFRLVLPTHAAPVDRIRENGSLMVATSAHDAA